jgi:anti-anti-sigma factor
MNESPAKIMVAVCDQAVFIQIAGRGDFNSSLDLKKLFDELRQRGFRRFVLELGQCVMMDSTFLGLLAGEALKVCDNHNLPPTPLELVNPNARIAEVLENLGVAHLFKITVCADPLEVAYQALSHSSAKSKAEVTRNCLEAHKTLMSLNPDNARKFKDVAEFLAEDLKRFELAEKKY